MGGGRKEVYGGEGGKNNLHAVHGSDGTLSRHWVVIRDEPEALTLLRHLVFEHCC